MLPAQEELFYSGLQSGDRFLYSRIRVKSPPLSRYKIKKLTQKSFLPQIGLDWKALNTNEQEAWKSAGEQCGLSAYRLFVKDKCARIKNGISGNATPSDIHQVWAGDVHIESPATQIKLVQPHPRNYYIYKKLFGTKSQYSPVLVTEDIALPFQLACSYASNFTVVGPNPYSKIYARFWYSYQGVNRYYDLEIPLDFQTEPKVASATISNLVSIVVGYDLYIEVNDLQGDLLIDNIKAIHSGQNWTRDPYMQDFNQTFTKSFYQIPKHWAAEIMPDGAQYDSIYPPD